MIVTLFRWRLHPGMRSQFVGSWEQVTDALKAHGSQGSALFEQADGTMRGIARWPDRATRDAAFAAGVAPEASERMRAAIAETLEREDMDAVSVRWVPVP